MKDVLLVVHDDGVSGVGSALVADDHSGVRGEDVHDAALAFVAPLHSYDYVSASLHCDTPLYAALISRPLLLGPNFVIVINAA